MVEQPFERVYLAQNSVDSKEDIYIDSCPVVEHQLNGIRYLYKALIKKTPGVILNDPSGYGKRVQTALFLGAVLPTLAQPALILCREGSEQHWMGYFQEWTKISDGVSIEQSNPFAKKKVLISPIHSAVVFAKREWSVLVVDYDVISKDVQKSTLKADLRIWINSSPIKEDLEKFSSFFTWIYPKAKFSADKFKADKRDLNDVLLKAAMLDAFLEDFVLRRDWGVTPFKESQFSFSNKTVGGSKVTKITKKNKDATGTKTKRSKRKSVETALENDSNKMARTTKIINTIDNNTEVFDIGNFDNVKTLKVRDMNAQSDEEDFTPLNRKSKKSKALWDSEDSEDEKEDKAHSSRKDKSKDNTQLDDSGEQLQVLRWDSDTESENGRLDNLNGGKTKPRLKMCMPEVPEPNHEIKGAEVDEVKDSLENNGNLLNENQNLSYIINNSKIMNEINPIRNNKFSEDLFSTDWTTNHEINDKVKETVHDTKTAEEILPTNPNNLKVMTIVFETESAKYELPPSPSNLKGKQLVFDTESIEGILPTSPNHLKERKIVFETENLNDVKLPASHDNSKVKEIEDCVTKYLNQDELIENNKTPVNANLSSFEIKMKELEERTMKKYKGSFLDSII